jgi:positive regulator of sigma E activity
LDGLLNIWNNMKLRKIFTVIDDITLNIKENKLVHSDMFFYIYILFLLTCINCTYS